MQKFHECVRSFVNSAKKTEWSPRQLYSECNDLETANKLATFFNNISNQYQPLKKEQIPTTFTVPTPIIAEKEVKECICEGKKPKSRVPGDIFIDVLTGCVDTLVQPIARIFNAAVKSNCWPTLWKTEYVTVIPKNKLPENKSDCRNISCTNYLSKILERIVLGWVQQYVRPRNNQFGGQRGCSTYHFLAEVIDQVTEHLEDSRAASVLTSIDYSKAFNCVEHLPLLRAFADKGAPNYVIGMLAAFLSERKMTVKIGSSYSELK